MCLDCGCHEPSNDHGDHRHLLLSQLQGAADASGIPLDEAARNVADTVEHLGAEEVFLSAFAATGKRAKRRKGKG